MKQDCILFLPHEDFANNMQQADGTSFTIQ
jgi:hypothetical protein